MLVDMPVFEGFITGTFHWLKVDESARSEEWMLESGIVQSYSQAESEGIIRASSPS